MYAPWLFRDDSRTDLATNDQTAESEHDQNKQMSIAPQVLQGNGLYGDPKVYVFAYDVPWEQYQYL